MISNFKYCPKSGKIQTEIPVQSSKWLIKNILPNI